MRRSHLGFSLGCLLAAAAWPVLPALSAEAQGFAGRPTQKAAPPRPILDRTPDYCATYGEGFVRVQGTNTCVKIGGHLRVDTTTGPRSQLEWGPGGFGAAPDDDSAFRSHVRLDGNFSGAR